MVGFAWNLDDRRGGRGFSSGVSPERAVAGMEVRGISLRYWDLENSGVIWSTAVPK